MRGTVARHTALHIKVRRVESSLPEQGGHFGIPGTLFVGLLFVLYQERARSRDSDTFVYCSECGYRIDNLPGPRCPEMG